MFLLRQKCHVKRNCKTWKNKQKDVENHNKEEEQNTTDVQQ